MTELPDEKPDREILPLIKLVGAANNPLIINPGLVSTALIVANALPPSTAIWNVRYATLESSMRGSDAYRDIFLLLPSINYEPRRAEAFAVERRLSSLGYNLSPIQDSSLGVRLGRSGQNSADWHN
jgi:hypothetical protein